MIPAEKFMAMSLLDHRAWLARALTVVLRTHTRGRFKWRDLATCRRSLVDRVVLQEVMLRLGAPKLHDARRQLRWLDLRPLQDDDELTVLLALLADEDAPHPRAGWTSTRTARPLLDDPERDDPIARLLAAVRG